MGWYNRFTEFELWQLRWLVAEGHTPTSASLVVGRSAGGLIKKAQLLGCPFGGLKEGREFVVGRVLAVSLCRLRASPMRLLLWCRVHLRGIHCQMRMRGRQGILSDQLELLHLHYSSGGHVFGRSTNNARTKTKF